MRRILGVLAVVVVGLSSPARSQAVGNEAVDWRKVQPRLANHIEARFDLTLEALSTPDIPPDAQIEVVVRFRAGADVPGLRRAVVRPFVDPLGLQIAIAEVRLVDLVDLVAARPVVAIEATVPAADPPKSPDPSIPDPHTASHKPPLAASARIQDWREVHDIHRSRAAWQAGYTGAGVRVLVNDSGIDFCHPDLQGTWATVTDPASPQVGWPMMFDSYSLYLLARDQQLGESNIALGLADLADTSATCAGGFACVHRPIGAERALSYRVPGTSRSGTYHIGSHPDTTLMRDDRRAAVLVVDENVAGVYDTVYVDLDNNLDFRNDPPASVASPAACGSYTGASYSGGLVYFIADGATPVPASDWLWELDPPANGSLVAFAINDFNESGGRHGQLCASAVAAQGVVNGGAPPFKPPYQGPGDGMVVGGGRDAGLVSAGNTYASPILEDPFLFAALGYDGVEESGDEVQIISNSWGHSTTDNDGWDLPSRLLDSIQQELGPSLSIVFSAGNGAPGYGTVAPPNPAGGIVVGASTEMGSTGWDQITSADSITWGDVAPFSNRGPGARGTVGIDVVAVGASAAGSIPVNQSADDVDRAWTTWSGTSRAAPVAAGNLALVYDAYQQAHGRWPTAEIARALLMAGADTLHYDPFVMGAGMVNADRSTALAAGSVNGGSGGVLALPPAWSAGGWRGAEIPAFASIVDAGVPVTRTFELRNSGAQATEVAIAAHHLVQFGEPVELDWTTADVSSETAYDFDRPNYLRDITPLIPAGADLLVVRTSHILAELDHDGDLEEDSRWRVLLYDWRDDGDGTLWIDSNGDGTVAPDELDADDQYVRFTYANNVSTTQELRVQRPLERMHDGIWLGLQHQDTSAEIPVTHLRVVVEFYRSQPWPWLQVPPVVTVPGDGSATFDATLTAPAETSPGMFQGFIVIDDDAHETRVPVSVAVAGKIGTDPLVLGGEAARTPSLPYDNGVVRGYFDWSWRADSGDWRFFFVDVGEVDVDSAQILVNTSWDDVAPPTDIDTVLMGPVDDDASVSDPDRYGPYSLGVVARSSYQRRGAGVWGYATSSGAADDWVAAELRPGLHVVAVHNVLHGGRPGRHEIPFTISLGRIDTPPTPFLITTSARTGVATYTVSSGVPLDRLAVEAFGLGCPPDPTIGQVAHAEEYTMEVEVAHAGRMDVLLDGPDGTDLDLVLIDPSGRTAATSATSGPDESVTVSRPADGTWTVRVSGYAVPTGVADFELTVDLLQGRDLVVTDVPPGPFASGQKIPVELTYTVSEVSCQPLQGLLVYGPPGGEVIEAPITLRVRRPRRPGGRTTGG